MTLSQTASESREFFVGTPDEAVQIDERARIPSAPEAPEANPEFDI